MKEDGPESIINSGNIIYPIGNGVAMMCFKYRYEMEEALSQWEEHKKALPIPPENEIYSFAYWLYRYSGLVVPQRVKREDEMNNAMLLCKAKEGTLSLDEQRQLAELTEILLKQAKRYLADTKTMCQNPFDVELLLQDIDALLGGRIK